ncbi:MAG: methylenetetrahydrofolate--tRNA-(uracil(54)-C(5))-methyltransferase (FADH(2)-oxidizing) TrmFO [Bdellovibrionota bacterium]
MKKEVLVIGGGMAGVEAAMLLARRGIHVDLMEMRPTQTTAAHKTDQLGELVCSNSLGSNSEHTAPSILKREMRAIGSLILEAAEHAQVPAGSALSVDREKFANWITEKIAQEKNIRVVRQEQLTLPSDQLCIVATGPLTSDALAAELATCFDKESLYFYDSISPIIDAQSIDESQCYFANRYDQERGDYLNCPLDKDQYETLVQEILDAEKVPLHQFEEMKCFESCMPIEVMASRGMKTLAFGPMKPVGLEHPKTGKRPYAVVQLRKENEPTTMYNMVGFQSRMKWPEQKRVFRMIPGLQQAEFIRMGSMHRNTYIDSPRLLHEDLSIKNKPNVFVAGQLTGVEGYVESAAMGLWSALKVYGRITDSVIDLPPIESGLGSLIRVITCNPLKSEFSPMNMNFGIFPPMPAGAGKKKGKKERRALMDERAQKAFDRWMDQGMRDHSKVSMVTGEQPTWKTTSNNLA